MITSRNILICLILIVLGFFIFSDPKYINTDVQISKIDTFYKHDTLIKYKKGDLIPFAVLDTFYLIDSMTIHDTPQMIYNYLSVKAYSDTFRIDTHQIVYIQDTISQNKIIGRSYKADFTQKTIVITNDITKKPKNQLFVGLIGDIRRIDNMIGIGVGLNYKKQNESYIVNLTTNQISIGLYKKIF